MKSNDSFRKFLEEARSAPEKKSGEAQPPQPAANNQKKKSQGSEKYRRLLAAKQKESEDSGPAYRDRASERRKDLTQDDAGVLGDEALALANVSADMSKYLGGDVSRTHLVKGLDYALLNKVKSRF